ncbi:uncharacterized protein LOC116250130 isoform X1 [Nymphaea colorata]|nr:uncharacterized protein LOC116250130 isoform X1 [Nymphaea colorata]
MTPDSAQNMVLKNLDPPDFSQPKRRGCSFLMTEISLPCRSSSRKHEIIIVRINLSNDRFSPYDFVIKDQRTNKILLRGPKKRTLLGLKEPATTKYEQLVFTSQGCNPL